MDLKDDNKKTLIYEELIKLAESFTNYFAGELQDFLGLITFFEQISSQIKEIVQKMKLPKNYKFDNPDYLFLKSLYYFHSSNISYLSFNHGLFKTFSQVNLLLGSISIILFIIGLI